MVWNDLADLAKPIVSLSLGCAAIFLLGGETRETAPTAVLLRSGDAVVLAGESRRRYHGVPRIFARAEGTRDGAGVEILGAPREVSDPACWPEQPLVARWAAETRVNVSVRDIA